MPRPCHPEPFAVILSAAKHLALSLRVNYAKHLHWFVFKEILQMLRSELVTFLEWGSVGGWVQGEWNGKEGVGNKFLGYFTNFTDFLASAWDGGYLRTQDIEEAHQQRVALFVPPKPARHPEKRGRELELRLRDSEAVQAWKQRMGSEEGKRIYRQRAATSETVNADLRTYRGLSQITVRGLAKARCVALWCALAYNVMHFARVWLG